MTEHDDTKSGGGGDVLQDGGHRFKTISQLSQLKEKEKIIPEYDATVDVGIKTIIYNAAIERIDKDGEETIEVPKVQQLRASVAVARCLMPIRLRGREIRAIRKILGLTAADLAKKLDEKAAGETMSRWENEAQPMGGYAEKVLRLFVCETLTDQAKGIDYKASMIPELKMVDPWRIDENYEMPPIQLTLIALKEQQSGNVIEAWDQKKAA